MIQVEIANNQSKYPTDRDMLAQAVRLVLAGEGIEIGQVSIAVVDDTTIHELNRRYLQHDYATDVLSFLLSSPDEPLEGEVIVSIDTAAREAVRYGWNTRDELLLYLVHGTLHLLGFDDATDAERAEMREHERLYLAQLGLCPNYEDRAASVGESLSNARSAEGDSRP